MHYVSFDFLKFFNLSTKLKKVGELIKGTISHSMVIVVHVRAWDNAYFDKG